MHPESGTCLPSVVSASCCRSTRASGLRWLQGRKTVALRGFPAVALTRSTPLHKLPAVYRLGSTLSRHKPTQSSALRPQAPGPRLQAPPGPTIHGVPVGRAVYFLPFVMLARGEVVACSVISRRYQRPKRRAASSDCLCDAGELKTEGGSVKPLPPPLLPFLFPLVFHAATRKGVGRPKKPSLDDYLRGGDR